MIEFCSHRLLLFCEIHCFLRLDVALFYAIQEKKLITPIVDLISFFSSFEINFSLKLKM